VVPVLALAAAAGAARPELHPGYGTLAWAPGGEIAFGAVGIEGVYAVRADGGGPRRLAAFGDGDSSLDWSPDGARLLVSSGGAVSVVADGRARRVATGYAAVWSPDGRRMAFSGRGGFFIARADGSGRVLVARSRYVEQAANVTWSPDGTRIAYVACRAPAGSYGCEHSSSFDVFTSSAGGGARRRVTAKTGFPQCVTWSRTGVLAWATGNGTTAVARPGAPVRLLRPGGGCPVWSPDGRRLVVATATGLGFVDADGTGRRYVRLGIAGTADDPVWSPDGRTVALRVVPASGNPAGLARLFTFRVGGVGFRRLPLPEP
jgi:Tol biopolymer transport system component